MTYYNLVRIIFLCLTVVIPAYLILFKKGNPIVSLFTVFLCFACTFSYDFELFGVVNLQQIILVLITFLGMGKLEKKDLRQNQLKRNVFLYIAFLSVMTILGYLPKMDYMLVGTIVQNQLRPVVQIVFMVFSYLAWLVCSTINGEDSKKILVVFYRTLLVIAVVAIAQSVIYRYTSFDILPMRKDFISETEGLSAVAESGFLRATAGVGEPKQLAKFLAIGFALQLLSHKFLGYEKIKITHLTLFVVATFFSASVTGYIIMLVAFVFFCLKISSKYPIVLPLFAGFAILATVFVFNTDLVADKLLRAKESGDIVGLENTDSATLRWILAEPLFAILGVGLRNTVAYANKYAKSMDHFINSYPYTLRRGFVYHLAETGIVGTIIFMKSISQLYQSCKKNPEIKYMFLFIIIMYMFLTKEAILILQILLMTLLSNCGYHELKKESSAMRKTNENSTN